MIPGLKQSLLDPVPEVRTVSARALGAMVKGMGSNKFDELMNWLMETLKSEGSSVDRSGAAQGRVLVCLFCCCMLWLCLDVRLQFCAICGASTRH